MKLQQLNRVFLFNGTELMDINPKLSAEAVMEVYSNTYPALINAHIVEKETSKDKITYEFVTIAGTKG